MFLLCEYDFIARRPHDQGAWAWRPEWWKKSVGLRGGSVYCSSAASLGASIVPGLLILRCLPMLLPLWFAQDEPPPGLPAHNPYTTAADIERGARLFHFNCAVCHGPAGTGGKGANLAQAKLRRAPDDHALFLVVRQGIPGTEMPPG